MKCEKQVLSSLGKDNQDPGDAESHCEIEFRVWEISYELRDLRQVANLL
jgi:hypothetical protein